MSYLEELLACCVEELFDGGDLLLAVNDNPLLGRGHLPTSSSVFELRNDCPEGARGRQVFISISTIQVPSPQFIRLLVYGKASEGKQFVCPQNHGEI